MSMPATHHPAGPMADFIERHETLKMIMEWIADRFADSPGSRCHHRLEDGEGTTSRTGLTLENATVPRMVGRRPLLGRRCCAFLRAVRCGAVRQGRHR